MPFFHYSQNNSGGKFKFHADGITHHVIIEAKNAEKANSKAEEIGIYFNGCDEGLDCRCCGDRWYNAYGDGDATPQVYGEPVDRVELLTRWMGKNPEIVVHYADGRMVWHKGKTKK